MGTMRRLDEAFERRDQIRVSRRLACALLVSGRRHEGLVSEISARSLLVHTEADLPPGAGVVLSLGMPGGMPMVLETSVRERRPLALPHRLQGGLPSTVAAGRRVAEDDAAPHRERGRGQAQDEVIARGGHHGVLDAHLREGLLAAAVTWNPPPPS